MSRYQRPVTCFHAKVAGVTHDNRQAAIAKLSALETLDLVPEPDNPHDPNAIKVWRRTGEHIGYLKRNRARQLVEKLQLGHRCVAFVKRVSGGETHYVSITVLVISPEATDQEVLDWINRYDVLGGITLSLSPEGKLVASPAMDLVPDVTARPKKRRGPSLTLRFEPPTPHHAAAGRRNATLPAGRRAGPAFLPRLAGRGGAAGPRAHHRVGGADVMMNISRSLLGASARAPGGTAAGGRGRLRGPRDKGRGQPSFLIVPGSRRRRRRAVVSRP